MEWWGLGNCFRLSKYSGMCCLADSMGLTFQCLFYLTTRTTEILCIFFFVLF